MKGYSENYWAKRAGQYNKTNWVKNEDFIDSFLNMLPRTNFETILEVGIGTGAVANKVSEIIGHLTGIDISKEMIAKINHPGMTPIVANAHNLPFEDSSFELIYMRNVIHYIDDPALAFSEIYRCLKKNGYFFVVHEEFRYFWVKIRPLDIPEVSSFEPRFRGFALKI